MWIRPPAARAFRFGRGLLILDPNFLAAHLTAASLVALGLASRGRKWALWVLAAVGMLGVVALTLSRSAWLAAAAGIVVLAVTGALVFAESQSLSFLQPVSWL